MARVIKAPAPLQDGFSVFLSGCIEMGLAENWQARVERELINEDVIILNPRRDDWDSSWIQSKNNLKFREQVDWELSAMEKADIITIVFLPKYKSPITLLELGLFAHTGKLIVCCPNGFWRKGNVDIVCERYSIQQVESLDALIHYLHGMIATRQAGSRL